MPEEGLETRVLAAEEGRASFRSGTAVNVLVTGVPPDAQVEDVTEGVIPLRPSYLDTGGVYFRVDANRTIEVR